MAAVEALFAFPPFFNTAAAGARRKIIKRAESIGLDWTGAMQDLQVQFMLLIFETKLLKSFFQLSQASQMLRPDTDGQALPN